MTALHGPVWDRLQHEVTLPAPRTPLEQYQRWDRAQHWCREHVDHAAGHQWTRRVDPRTDDYIFGFSDLQTALLFKLQFG